MIIEGTWEAENGVIVIHPKGQPKSLLIYSANAVGCQNPAQTVAEWKAEWKAKLEANARTMAATPEMIALLEECADELGAVLPTLAGKCVELLKRIRGEDAI